MSNITESKGYKEALSVTNNYLAPAIGIGGATDVGLTGVTKQLNTTIYLVAKITQQIEDLQSTIKRLEERVQSLEKAKTPVVTQDPNPEIISKLSDIQISLARQRAVNPAISGVSNYTAPTIKKVDRILRVFKKFN
ncbi:unnamed protein product [Commelina yellow mottle virus]|uniref:Uncharacterized 15 kDa protein n=1 Tax=Commelina yellow mottle virus TaxID=10653 RepID=YOR2_COYMV|nr:hypothetical protein ComYMVgp2 [Commelina yellow mottle virus]P19201.1 RecName: Full=Uncharacterized 15 kDa protein; AltName: Full=ORF2 [Commelina yellow mottle virus]CAA37109.1 unnamed protein product [Commelina yellow mottle virus]